MKLGSRNVGADNFYNNALRIGIVISNWEYYQEKCKAKHPLEKFQGK
jgi:hypothetical protein